MTLLVTTNAKALADRLAKTGRPADVLAFKPADADAARHGLRPVAPELPDPAERLALLDEYVAVIAALGEQHGFSTTWLCHPISQRSDLDAYPLFNQMVDFIAFRRHWDTRKASSDLAVLVPHEALARSIEGFAREEGLPVETPGMKVRPGGALGGLRRAWSRWRGEWKFFGQLGRCAARARPFLDAVDRSARYTLIRTSFDHRSRPLIESDRDIFLGRLPGFLLRRGRRLLYYGGTPDLDRRFAEVIDDLGKITDRAVLPEVAMIRTRDRWAVLLFCLTAPGRLHLPEKIELGGVDVALVVRHWAADRKAQARLRSNFMSARAIGRFAREFDVEEAFTQFENKTAQQLLVRAMHARRPPVPVKAFQHAQIARGSSRFFLGPREAAAGFPLPDRILTLGAYTREYLVGRKHYPAERVSIGCALRQDPPHHPPDDDDRPRHKRLLACLWTMERSAEMLGFLLDADPGSEGWRVRVRPHPANPIDRVEKHLGRTVGDAFEIATATLARDLSDCDVVIYSGTTTCLDALAAGRPVITVEFDDLISPDPLFQFDDFKWTVRTGAELRRALADIAELPDGEYRARRRRALDFVSDYFHPVNEENLKKFLE